jgi:NADH dehydrogenase (ubiquinone) 1 beta subcomplex subunit 6
MYLTVLNNCEGRAGARRVLLPYPSSNKTGYTPDEKLRLQQLLELRRRWLKDQELSPWEPVLPLQKLWPMEAFWSKFCSTRLLGRTYQSSIFAVTHVLTPAWVVHYYVRYHGTTKPYAIVERKPRIFPVSLKRIFLLFTTFLSHIPSDH